MAIRTDVQAHSVVPAKAPRASRPGELFERHFGQVMPLPAALTIALLILFPLAFNPYMGMQATLLAPPVPVLILFVQWHIVRGLKE
jgi:hypothetical protein